MGNSFKCRVGESKVHYLPSRTCQRRSSSVNRIGLTLVTLINIFAGIALLRQPVSTTSDWNLKLGNNLSEAPGDLRHVVYEELKDGLNGATFHLSNSTSILAVESNSTTSDENASSAASALLSQNTKNDQPAGFPKIALLMSFPNSGTSYTLSNVRLTSRRATASHYCNSGSNSTYKPVYPRDVENRGPHLIQAATKLELPENYILTKTHCGGFCMDCAPGGYKISLQVFEEECFKVCNEAHTRHKQRSTYSPTLVGKVVHLFRSPFDNVISRFHLHLKNSPKRNDTIDLDVYSRDARGFQAFCRDLDLKYRRQDKTYYSSKVYQLIKQVPCHADFIRYAQWHNYAFDMIQDNSAMKEIPVHVLHYEDFRLDYNKTVNKLLHFLELPWRDRDIDATTFHWTNYSLCFDNRQRHAAMKLMSLGASPNTEVQIKRYAP